MTTAVLIFFMTMLAVLTGFVMGRCTKDKNMDMVMPKIPNPFKREVAADEVPDWDRAVNGDSNERIHTI